MRRFRLWLSRLFLPSGYIALPELTQKEIQGIFDGLSRDVLAARLRRRPAPSDAPRKRLLRRHARSRRRRGGAALSRGRHGRARTWRFEPARRAGCVPLGRVRRGSAGRCRGVGARALELADIVSFHIWGGDRGWEKANPEQFEILKDTLREKLRVKV